MVASVDLDDLPRPTAEEIRAALDQVDFDRPRARAGGRRTPGAADSFQYDLEVIDGGHRSLTAHEPLSDPGLQALSEVLMQMAEPE